MFNQGDILIIPIPFTDLTSKKKRPVLVLSNSSYNRKTNDIIVAAITSDITQKDYAVFISNKDLKTGKLKVNSCIRVDKLYTLSQNIVIKKFGNVKNYILEEVKAKLKELLF